MRGGAYRLRAVRRHLRISDFSIDLAASAENAVCAEYLDEETDALSVTWDHDGWAWLNPPFGNIEPWVRKAYESFTNVAMLVPSSTGANWWVRWVHEKAVVLFMNGRITFVGELYAYPKDCALLLYTGPRDPGVAYEIWQWRKDIGSVD